LSLEAHVCCFWDHSSLFIFFSGLLLDLRMTFEDEPAHLGGRAPQLASGLQQTSGSTVTA
jgi:hypothetical protein